MEKISISACALLLALAPPGRSMTPAPKAPAISAKSLQHFRFYCLQNPYCREAIS